MKTQIHPTASLICNLIIQFFFQQAISCYTANICHANAVTRIAKQIQLNLEIWSPVKMILNMENRLNVEGLG